MKVLDYGDKLNASWACTVKMESVNVETTKVGRFSIPDNCSKIK